MTNIDANQTPTNQGKLPSKKIEVKLERIRPCFRERPARKARHDNSDRRDGPQGALRWYAAHWILQASSRTPMQSTWNWPGTVFMDTVLQASGQFHMDSIGVLDLANLSIDSIDKKAFDECATLHMLDLSGNALRDIAGLTPCTGSLLHGSLTHLITHGAGLQRLNYPRTRSPT